MAIDTDLEWYGDDKKKDLDTAMIRFLIRGTNKIQETARLLVRKDTTNLMGSIVKAVDRSGLEGTVYTNSEYAIYNEFGTGRFATKGTGRSTPWVYKDAKGNWRWTTGMTAQPFMRPGLNNNKKILLEMAKQEGIIGVNK